MPGHGDSETTTETKQSSDVKNIEIIVNVKQRLAEQGFGGQFNNDGPCWAPFLTKEMRDVHHE